MTNPATLPSDAHTVAVQQRIRVLLVGPSLDIVGGQSIQLARMLERFSEDPSIDAAFLAVNPRLPGPLRKLQSIKYVRTVVTTIAYVLSLLRTAGKYDVLHIFSASYWSFLLAPVPALLAARLYGRKSILNYRSGEAEDHLQNWPSATRFIRLADRVVVPSGYLVDVFGRFGLPTSYIYNFVDLRRFRFRSRIPLRPVFLSNRNFEAHYNVACVLRAFASVQQHYPEASLTVVGDGPQAADLRELAASLHLSNVRWMGQVPNQEMFRFYDEADIYLNSPDLDNMPGSIIEAYACGLPVVTTNAGGIPYIVTHEETGLMTEKDDHQTMAEHALRLLSDPDLATRLTSNGLRRCEQFSWEAVREQWLALYQNTASPSSL